jgi:hypothetical protein
MHPAYLTVHPVQHFPVVCPKLVLHSDRQVPTTLLQHTAIDAALAKDRPGPELVDALAEFILITGRHGEGDAGQFT